jgi:archaellum component FlaC
MLVSIALMAYGTNSYAKKLYRWVDPDGTVRYSDQVPPDQAGLGRSEMTPTGYVEREVPKAKSAEEIARERALEQEKRRQSMIASSRKEEEKALLRRFQTLEALDQSLESQLSSIQQIIDQAQKQVSSIDKSLNELEKRAADMERRQSEPPREVYAQIDKRLEEKNSQQAVVLERQKQADTLKNEFADYRKRYIMLLGIVEEVDEDENTQEANPEPPVGETTEQAQRQKK